MTAAKPRQALTVLAIGLVATLALASLGFAKTRMQSTKLGPLLCETTGGGKFVAIPDFPGEKIDRRLLSDLTYIERRYPIFITDGYSMDDVHSQNGEHPLGLALDIVPNKAAGGSWNDVDRLARWAEPRQNHPRAPFRWVGYDGDDGHGRGHHLHLSWSHTDTKPGRPAATVYTVRCPSAVPVKPPAPEPPDVGGVEAVGGAHAGGHRGGSGHGGRSGGGKDPVVSGSGGIGGKRGLAPVAVETDGDGVGLGD